MTQITGYFDGSGMGIPVSAIPWSKYTRMNMFAASLNSRGQVVSQYITPADTVPFVSAAKTAGVKSIICIMDNETGDPGGFVNATAPAKIAATVSNIVAYVNSNGFDGVDLDWEQNLNVAQYIDLITKLRTAMPGKLITAAMGMGNNGAHVAIASASYAKLDLINLMCYDEDWVGNKTWFNDWLYGLSPDGQEGGSEWITKAFTSAGVPIAKLGLGIPLYGRKWTGVRVPNSAGTKVGEVAYNKMVTDPTRWLDMFKVLDPTHFGQYLSISTLNEFISYCDQVFIREAVKWGKIQGFGGYMTFSLSKEYLPSQQGDLKFPLSSELSTDVMGTTSATPPPLPTAKRKNVKDRRSWTP
jgi:hypothetical protein